MHISLSTGYLHVCIQRAAYFGPNYGYHKWEDYLSLFATAQGKRAIGNDYWVWEKIVVVDPVIVIMEYNSIFGPNLAVTISYETQFAGHQARYSGQFWGASLHALKLLADRKVTLLSVTIAPVTTPTLFAMTRLPICLFSLCRRRSLRHDSETPENEKGKLTYLTGAERFHAIAELEVYDLRQNKIASLSSLRGAIDPIVTAEVVTYKGIK